MVIGVSITESQICKFSYIIIRISEIRNPQFIARSNLWQTVRAHLFITGRVQGVFFRACTREEAQKRKLTGWVKNLYDGRVEAVFEGEEEAVQSMISWCHSGTFSCCGY